MSQNDLDQYLGTCDPEHIGDKIVERFKRWRASLGQTGAYTQWARNFSQYNNGPAEVEDGGAWSDSFALEGENSEILSIRINEMRNLITHILNLTYSKPVGARAIAASGNADSLQAANVADALLQEDFRSAGGTKLMRRAGEGALIVSTSFVMAEWDFSGGEEVAPDEMGIIQMSGEPRLTDFWVDEVCFDGTKKDWRDVYEVILLRRYNRFELASRYPGHEDEILNAPRLNKSPFCGFRWREDDSDDVVVFEYLHRKVNGRFLPQGRRALCLEDGRTLEDGPNPYSGLKEINVYPVTAAQGLGTVYGYAIANDISPINRFINLLATIVATNCAAYGSPNIVGPKLQMVDVQNLMGGARYFGVGPNTDIKPLNLLPDMRPIAELMQMFSSYGEKVSGINNIMRGDTGDMSGIAIAQAKSMVVQFMSSFQQSVVEQHESLFNALIWLRKTFSSGIQKVAKLGAEHSQEIIEYDAKETLGKVARVRAEAIDPVMSTPEGREQRADKIMAQGGFEHPWEYITLVKTGRDDTLFRGPISRNLLIQRENGQMIRGEQPLVLQQDDHQKHEAEHLCLLDDPGVRANDSITQIVLEHNAKHTLYRMGLNVMQGVNPMTGQPYPSAIIQLEQAKQMAQQQQQMMAPPPDMQQGQQVQQPQEPQRQQTAQESLQQAAISPPSN